MSSEIEKFLDRVKGFWLKSEHVKVGDRILILEEPRLDEKTFDRPYLIIKGRLLRTNEEFNIRLGSRNVARITEVLGKDSWKGKQIEVISIENFAGLGKKGIMFRGVMQTTLT